MRKLATIEKIADIQPIPNADQIVAVKVREWWVVAKKDQFQIGSPCVFFEIDSFLPITPVFEFLLKGSKPKKMLVDGAERDGIRLKTIKLRGQISQGLVLPIDSTLENHPIGTDVSEIIGVVKWEMPIPANLSGTVKGDFPSFIPKTDEIRVQNCAEILETHRGVVCYITSKLDGTSATFFKRNGEFGACSRNLDLKDTEGNTHWQIARQYQIAEKLPDGFAIQGEIVGHGIQDNPHKLAGQQFFAYNVFNIQKQKYLDYKDFVAFVHERGWNTVPVINDHFILEHNAESLLAMATAPCPLNRLTLQEGIVIRPLVEMTATIDRILSRFSFKAISNEYLLKHEN